MTLPSEPTARVPWSDVEPLGPINGDVTPLLESVHSFKAAWKETVAADPKAFEEARKRSLRRHAIETGIIERLYDVDWGVTEALVAEGLTADAAARADSGSISDDVLATITAQYDALRFLVEAARDDNRDVTVGLIKELHVALTRTQATYTATGPNGINFQATLHHGQWKEQDNHVRRPDGTLLEYTPADHVPAQIDRMIELYRRTEDVDPIVRAAFLHHRFVRIHPFEDGNGRVARCLTLLTLLRADLAPLVVDRRERDTYLRALDAANDGDLRPLIRFFARLEIVALRSELERPVEHPIVTVEAAPAGGALAVLSAGVERLQGLRDTSSAAERSVATAALAGSIQTNVIAWLRNMGEQFERTLVAVDSRARSVVSWATPPDPSLGFINVDDRARWYRWQIVTAARSADFFVNLSGGTWWTRLRLTALGQRLDFLVFLQRVGRGETGVLAMTVYGEVIGPSGADDEKDGEHERPTAERVAMSSPTETVTWIHTDSVETHWDDVVAVLDAGLAAALLRYTSGLG